jgi:hypothetical protein
VPFFVYSSINNISNEGFGVWSVVIVEVDIVGEAREGWGNNCALFG